MSNNCWCFPMNSVSISEKGLNLGQCGIKKRNDWKKIFYLDFVSDGTGDMAICEVEADIGGNFGSMKYGRKNYNEDSVWTNDDYGKKSIVENWGPISRIGAVKQNKIRIQSVKLDFCVSNCANGIAEYVSNDISDESFLMKTVSMSLKDTRKGSHKEKQNIILDTCCTNNLEIIPHLKALDLVWS